ncbi:hypothetical protein DY052_07550 [Apilactobacillus timberlakei]|uniref:hypothetical protein n=1 Tax=Apilactobacillus timberlakei TaxID=2008380 RepID=UPI00112E0535|nr:hypothetical protein [Apilactobacillus timberlakei]TPR13708.1 hypothetical protein DY052_07550 [Apilactobacillus timberlakei]
MNMKQLSKCFDRNIQFGSQLNSNDLVNLRVYLEEYHVITEINGEFLTVGDPTRSAKIDRIINSLNEPYDNYEYGKYAVDAPVYQGASTKCIYDRDYFPTMQSVLDIGKCFSNGFYN